MPRGAGGRWTAASRGAAWERLLAARASSLERTAPWSLCPASGGTARDSLSFGIRGSRGAAGERDERFSRRVTGRADGAGAPLRALFGGGARAGVRQGSRFLA